MVETKATSITEKPKLPRAEVKTTATGIDLFYVEELGRVGIHQSGIARMLECHVQTVKNAWAVVKQEYVFEAEILTDGGIKVVKLADNKGFAAILRSIARSRCKEETRDRAEQVMDAFVESGFQFEAMMEVAPEQVKEMVDARQPETDAIASDRTMMVLQALAEGQKLLNSTISHMGDRISGLEGELRADASGQLPIPKVVPTNLRIESRKLVNSYAQLSGLSHEQAWAHAYTQFYYRYKFDADARLQNALKRGEKAITKLDIIERHGKLPAFFVMLKGLFDIEPVT